MFGPSLASQTGWLYPLAAVAAVCGLLWRRGRPRTDRIRTGFVLWGTWLTTYFLVFSAGSVGGHTYYMGVIAVPLAALAGGGLSLLWGAYRAGGRRGWVLPGAVAATVAWGACLAGEFPSFLPFVGGDGIARVEGTVEERLPTLRHTAHGVRIEGVVMAVVDPPRVEHGGDSSGQLTSEQRKLLAFTTAHQGSAEYVFATNGWNGASPYILATGAHVLPLGGFSGQVPFPTEVRFRQLVQAGKVRYVLLGQARGMAGMFGGGTGRGATPATRITDWVRSACARVPASAYDGAQPPTSAPARASAAAQTLYQCGPGR
ncbi:hypothetical protein GCM10010341_81970 [Streptomyces noursei]|nr:hypothetical protein GCM10010341_81970 [Streptomyces noursei]